MKREMEMYIILYLIILLYTVSLTDNAFGVFQICFCFPHGCYTKHKISSNIWDYTERAWRLH